MKQKRKEEWVVRGGGKGNEIARNKREEGRIKK